MQKWAILITFALAQFSLKAQIFAPPDSSYNAKFDTNYVKDFTHILTTRVYLSSKFNSMTLSDDSTGATVAYRPNNQVNMGFGFSYRAFTLNIGFGIGVLNTDDDVLGETSYFDAQGNMYSKKIATNLFFQTYQGYYIDSHTREQLGWPEDGNKKATRRDIRQSNIGLSSLYIFNNDKFSYRASFNQDAWQKKSAGSGLLGGYATYFTVRGDSSLVPSALDSLFSPNMQIKQGNFLDFGIMGGYTHSFVIAKHVFVTLSTVGGLGLSIMRNSLELPDGSTEPRSKTGAGYVFQGRFAMGWNSERNYVGVSYNNESSWSVQTRNERFGWSVGNFRINYVHRFNMRVVPLDKIFDGIGNLIKK